MLSRRTISWLVSVGIMGFALGESFVSLAQNAQPQQQERTPNPGGAENQQPAAENKGGQSPVEVTRPLAQPVSQQEAHKGEDSSSSKNWSKIFLDHLPDWFVAFFTAVLSLFTYKLWRATAGLWDVTQGLLSFAGEQASDMKDAIRQSSRSADAARDAADAAKASADGLKLSERATVFMREIKISGITDRTNVVMHSTLSNSGRTPAFIKKVPMRTKAYVISEKLPDAPLELKDTPERRFPLLPGDNRPHSAPFGSEITPVQLPHLLSKAVFLLVFGRIEFEDVFGDTYHSWFGYSVFFEPDGTSWCEPYGKPGFWKYEKQ